jgi:hypothetical protein
VTYAGSRYETPFKVKTYINAKRIVEAPDTTENGLRFDNWSNGSDGVEEPVHELVIGDGPQTWTATYVGTSGQAPGDQAAGAEALADAPLITPEDTDSTTGTPAHEDSHDHDAGTDGAPAADEPADEPAVDTADGTAAGRGRTGQPLVAERWNGIGGTTVEELTKSDAYRKQPPAQAVALDGLELPRTGEKDYGVRIRGYLLPPVDGEYRFWIAADDRGVLFLSTDETPDKKIVVAFTPQSTAAGEYEKSPEQITGPIALQAGERYYFEVLYKQGDSKDNLSVAWQLPGEERAVIDGEFLEGYQP